MCTQAQVFVKPQSDRGLGWSPVSAVSAPFQGRQRGCSAAPTGFDLPTPSAVTEPARPRSGVNIPLIRGDFLDSSFSVGDPVLSP